MAPAGTVNSRHSDIIESTKVGLQVHDQLPEEFRDRKLVGIKGSWYDVTDFIPFHPGGPILEQYVGHDATDVFVTMNHKDVLKNRTPVGTYIKPDLHPADKEFMNLHDLFEKRGYFKTDLSFYANKFIIASLLFVLVFVGVLCFDHWAIHMLSSVILFLSWQQFGFIMHDVMHTQITRKKNSDDLIGVFSGTVMFGLSAHWWQDEHIIHHAMTNTVSAEHRFADPQMWESVWAQNEELFPLFSGILQYCLIKIQHFTFIPMTMIFGRVVILTESYATERRLVEWVGIVLHYVWMRFLLYNLPSWSEVIAFYLIASWLEGILHLQLIIGHYCKLFLKVKDFHNTSWFVFQILSNMNIKTPWWQDWFYGGLNFHIEHHLFPKLARNKLREASDEVHKICIRHNIEYESCTISTAITKTLSHLKVTASHYKFDPR